MSSHVRGKDGTDATAGLLGAGGSGGSDGVNVDIDSASAAARSRHEGDAASAAPSGAMIELSDVSLAGPTTGKRGGAGLSPVALSTVSKLPAHPCAPCSRHRVVRTRCGWCSDLATAWEVTVVTTLFVSYLCLYYSKVHLFTVQAGFHEDEDVGKVEYADMQAAGYAVYLIGKFTYGLLCDRFGGKALVLTALAGSAASSLLFIVWPTGAYGGFLLSWCLLRAAQPAAWIGTVQVSSQWVQPERHGRVLSFLSLSFIAGNSFARAVLSLCIRAGMSWRGVVAFAACVTLTAVPVAWKYLVPSPESIGLPSVRNSGEADLASASSAEAMQPLSDSDDEADAEAEGVASDSPSRGGDGSVSSGVRRVRIVGSGSDGAAAAVTTTGVVETLAVSTRHLRVLLRNPHFIAVCSLAFMLTAIRETFMVASTEYLSSIGASDGDAAASSALLPLAGIPSVMLAGTLKDKAPHRYRGGIVAMFLVPLMLALGILSFTPGGVSFGTASALLFVSGLGLLGPYSLLSGVFALDIGGKSDSGLACGVSDAAGFSGAITMMLLSAQLDLTGLLAVMFCLAVAAFGTALWLWRFLWRRRTAALT